jgi:DNA-binding MarR family transcriptional regulator
LKNIGPYLARLAPLLPQLVIAYRRRGAELPGTLRKAGMLGQRHVGMLITVAISGPLSVSQLAQRADMTVAHASLVVGELAKAGLVQRDHDPQDRRRIIVSLSRTARPAVAEMRGRFAEPVARFLHALDEQQAEQFIRDLARLVAYLRDEVPSPAGAAGCRETGGPAQEEP